jgi:hypothetical protein
MVIFLREIQIHFVFFCFFFGAISAAVGRNLYLYTYSGRYTSDTFTWCESFCARAGDIAASIVDAEDHAEAVRLMTAGMTYAAFIGLTDRHTSKGQFKFADNAPTNFFFDAEGKPTKVWAPGHPTLTGSATTFISYPNENCVLLRNGLYYNEDCMQVQRYCLCSGKYDPNTPRPSPSQSPSNSRSTSLSTSSSPSSSISKSSSISFSATISVTPSVSPSRPGPWYTDSQVALDSNRRFYIHNNLKLSFENAQQHCAAHGVALASIHSSDESEVVNNLCKKFKTCLIGLTKQGVPNRKYRFVDGSSTDYILEGALSFWEDGDPKGECVEEIADEYQMWTRSQPAKCTKVQSFVCADLPVKALTSSHSAQSLSVLSSKNALIGVGTIGIVVAAVVTAFVGMKSWNRRASQQPFVPLP